MGVAKSTIARARQSHGLAHLGEIGDQGLAVLLKDLRAGRDLEDDGAPVAAGAIFAHALPAALGLEMLLVAIIDERIEAVDAFGHHIATGPAKLDKFLPAKGDAAVAAVAGADIDLRLVEKFHDAPGAAG